MVKLRPNQLRKTRSVLSYKTAVSGERPISKVSSRTSNSSPRKCIDIDIENVSPEALINADSVSLEALSPHSASRRGIDTVDIPEKTMTIGPDIMNTLKEICFREENQLAVAQAALAFENWRNSHCQVENNGEICDVEEILSTKPLDASMDEKDIEIIFLKEKVQILESDKKEEVRKLHTTITSLQDENRQYCKKVQSLMDQLAGKDQEILIQTQRINNLLPELEELRNKTTKYTKNNTQCQSESDTNKFFEDLGMALQFSSRGQTKSSEVVSMELQEHLKRLTTYVRELEMCLQNKKYNGGTSIDKQECCVDASNIALPIDPVMVCFKSSNQAQVADSVEKCQTRNKSNGKNSSSYLQNEYESEMIRESPRQLVIPTCQSPLPSENKKILQWNQGHTQEKTNQAGSTSTSQNLTNTLSSCVLWKWRWAAAAIQLQDLSKQLQNKDVRNKNKTNGNCVPAPVASPNNNKKLVSSMQKLGFIHVQNLHSPHSPTKGQCTPTKLKQKETRFSLPGHKIVSIILSIWRASTKNENLEKELVKSDEKLNRLLSGFPWLVQRFKERRQMERIFLNWALHMLRVKIQAIHSSVPRKCSGSPALVQPVLIEPKVVDGNGYQGRYMRYVNTKPSDRLSVSDGRKSYSKSPSQGYYEQMPANWEHEDNPSELSVSNFKDARSSMSHANYSKISPEASCSIVATNQHNNSFNSVNDYTWTKRSTITLQQLQVHESRNFPSRDRRAIPPV